MNDILDRLLTIDEVADWLNISKQTLYNWRSRGEGAGPPAIKLGSHVRYRRGDVEAYLAANTATSGDTGS